MVRKLLVDVPDVVWDKLDMRLAELTIKSKKRVTKKDYIIGLIEEDLKV